MKIKLFEKKYRKIQDHDVTQEIQIYKITSTRNIYYDLYVNGFYYSSFNDVLDALDYKHALLERLNWIQI